MTDLGRRSLIAVDLVEGTALYSDDEGFAQRRIVAHISLAMLLGDDGQAQTRWRTLGNVGSVAELIAGFYVSNPGIKDAVDGLFLRELKRRAGTL